MLGPTRKRTIGPFPKRDFGTGITRKEVRLILTRPHFDVVEFMVFCFVVPLSHPTPLKTFAAGDETAVSDNCCIRIL